MNNIKTILLIGRTGHGKSTLANVLTGTDKFKESAGSVSETRKIKFEEFEEDGIKYRVVDTVGAGDTSMSLGKVLRKLALMGYSVKDGLSQILFVTDGRLVEEAKSTYDLLREVIFDKDVAKYTTIVRARFVDFEKENKCKEEEKKMTERSEELKDLIKECGKIIYVNNPPVDVIGNEELSNLGKEIRKKSREKLLNHLRSVCQSDVQGDIYKPTNLSDLSNEISEHMKKKDE